jgi:hypothetical protein
MLKKKMLKKKINKFNKEEKITKLKNKTINIKNTNREKIFKRERE